MNAKKELLESLEWNSIVFAEIMYNWEYRQPEYNTYFFLEENYTSSELDKFLKSLDFEYDDWYWCQYIHWVVSLSDWSWLDRYAYDWSESWVRNIKPTQMWISRFKS